MRKTSRLDKVLAENGFGTRKDVKKLLRSGAVSVDGVAVTDADAQVDAAQQVVSVCGEALRPRGHVYLMMNKPAGVVSSTRDGVHQTVLDLLGGEYRRRFPCGELHLVGRLDIDAEGLLLLTTDGALTHALTSPKRHVPKEYFVRLRDAPSEAEKAFYVEKFAAGIAVPREGGEPAFTAQSARLVWADSGAFLTIHEGKYHQVKRMFAALGNEVVYLKRVAIGGLRLDPALAPGAVRELTEEEVGGL